MTFPKHSALPSDDLKERLLQLIRNPSKLCLTSDEGRVVLARIEALEAHVKSWIETAALWDKEKERLEAKLAKTEACWKGESTARAVAEAQLADARK